MIPVHKKCGKQLIANYRPVSLLPICGKSFETIIFNLLFVHFNNNNLLNSNQPGFRPGDSCIHQLISIFHDIYKAFDANPSLEVRGVFLDFPKYKLKPMGICEKYFGLIASFLCDRF